MVKRTNRPRQSNLPANCGELPITDSRRDDAEKQIIAHHKTVDYDTREYPVEVLVQKYLTKLDEDDNELFVPDYQRDLTWPESHQSKFIESVLIGLPIPYLFVADVEGKDGRLEIVDGSQRIRTLASFIQNSLQLSGLKKLDKLNGFRFKDLPVSRQRRFKRHTLRMIELTEDADEEVRRDIFERINTGSQRLTDMEVRWGVHDSPFLTFVRECSRMPQFMELAPLGEPAVRRREREEFVLRFFAYLENYQHFDRKVVDFLNEYLERAQMAFNSDSSLEQSMRSEWTRMLAFVKRTFPNGFSKAQGHVRTPRIRYEAISVGSALALRENPQLAPADVNWLKSVEFRELTTSDASNSRPKVIKRIEYVRDQLLGE